MSLRRRVGHLKHRVADRMDERRDGVKRARKALRRRAGRVKRWAVGGAVAIAGFFAGTVANATPPTDSGDASSAETVRPIASLGADTQAMALAPPAAAPRASQAASGAVSGGS